MNQAELEGRLSALVQQRNAAQDQVAVLAGQLTAALKRIEEYEARDKALADKRAKRKKPAAE